MKNLSLLIAFVFSICASPAFSQTNDAVNPVRQKKHKIFFRADFVGVNTSAYFAQKQYDASGAYAGISSSCALGYCISKKVRLGLGLGIIYDSYVGKELTMSDYSTGQLYASVEYGSHGKRRSPFIALNAGYSNMYAFNNYKATGPFVELQPGISYGSKSRIRWRLSLGNQLQFTTVKYTPVNLEFNDQYSGGRSSSFPNQPPTITYNVFVTRMMLKAGIEF